MSSKIAILGPGGVGGFLAAALDRVGEEVTVIARESTAELLRRDGISVESALLGEFHFSPRVVSQLEEPVDYLLVATKASGLSDALDRVKSEPEVVVPLLNGIDHLELLRERFGYERVVPATIRIEATATAVGKIAQTSPSVQVTLASEPAALQRSVKSLEAILTEAGVAVAVGGSEANVMWSKLVRINTIACCTAASGLAIGELRDDPIWREAFSSCATESMLVARAAGAEIDSSSLNGELERLHPGLKSSMLRDLEAGREPELDAIPGAVLRAAVRYGVECSTVQKLYEVIAEKAGFKKPD